MPCRARVWKRRRRAWLALGTPPPRWACAADPGRQRPGSGRAGRLPAHRLVRDGAKPRRQAAAPPPAESEGAVREPSGRRRGTGRRPSRLLRRGAQALAGRHQPRQRNFKVSAGLAMCTLGRAGARRGVLTALWCAGRARMKGRGARGRGGGGGNPWLPARRSMPSGRLSDVQGETAVRQHHRARAARCRDQATRCRDHRSRSCHQAPPGV